MTGLAVTTIAITTFALRQWEPERAGTRMVGLSPDDLVRLCNAAVGTGTPLVAGYAPFCKHLFLENPSQTRAAFAPITAANRHLLKSGYKARRESELAVLERWFEGLEAPRAVFLDVILYSHAQLLAEAAEGPEQEVVPDCDWGIVSIIGTLEASEPPMPPITQLRNALGRSEGGSGVAIDRAAYARAVDFWERHASLV
ncbi:MAG: DUF3228 family protein [Hyphomicrobiales bacterium]|nr:DUF3228 family protein [Hyphomicrobiales bacterium]